MPYLKDIGKTPIYTFGVCRAIYDENLSKFLDRVNVPNMREGIFTVYEDSYDAYVKKARRMNPFQRKLYAWLH